MTADPVALLGRFMEKQQRAEQFSEDIRKVINGGSAAGASSRTRSPGLAAGAALALGACSAAEATADSRAVYRQGAERARRSTCPFDDHSAFGAGPSDREARPRHTPPMAPEARFAHQDANQMGKHIREQQQKIGAGAPWDAPERGPVQSTVSAAASRVQQAVAVSGAASYSEAHAEAKVYQQRMRGSQDIISGGYLLGDSSAARRQNSLPPAGKMLLPQAHFALQYNGGSAKSISHHGVEYLNSKVLAESNRDRNETSRFGR
ncbi:unnamed protein product [Polarella glacialis]|uniref:Uncharacterized protein n=1 Tax=Polarella glacialis TaxID=89957 RepID=A0A813E201_POLGL|nr:unnamed protein product [Polarella glacialis]CAE8595041.1 unnamed protein product [Polarella glacialis]